MLAEGIYSTRPRQIVSESQLILTRDPATGETCYCSVMGTLGISLSVYVYIGAESYQVFRRLQREEISATRARAIAAFAQLQLSRARGLGTGLLWHGRGYWNKGARKACVSVAAALDSESGFVSSPEMTIPGGSVADALGRTLIKAMQTSQAIPIDVRVRSQRIKNA